MYPRFSHHFCDDISKITSRRSMYLQNSTTESLVQHAQHYYPSINGHNAHNMSTNSNEASAPAAMLTPDSPSLVPLSEKSANIQSTIFTEAARESCGTGIE
jgi:hypothetical protein